MTMIMIDDGDIDAVQYVCSYIFIMIFSIYIYYWLVVWNSFSISIYWEHYTHLANIFQMGWNQ